MRHKTILFAVFFLCCLSSFSQKGVIICSTQHNLDKSISINADAQVYADYTLRIVFTTLDGFTSRTLYTPTIALAVVNRGFTEAIRLVPDNSNNHTFQYKYQFFPGHSFNKMPDTNFLYLIPAAINKTVRISSVSSTISQLSKEMGQEFRGTGFNYKLDDTICAARAGIIYDCSDSVKVGEATEVAYNRNRNRIFIEHRDGTIATYAITAPIKLLVQPGEEVFPGQPLAVFNMESPRYMVIFSITYLNEKKLLTENNPNNVTYYAYLPTYFYAGENDKRTILERNKQYIIQHPQEIIAAEMTKKEKKKFGY